MQSGWRVGSLFGIPLFLDTSWFFIVLWVAFANGVAWLEKYPYWGSTLAYSAGLVMALALFASVLLHELGHSLVALSQGIQVRSITLYLFGGVAAIAKEPKTPGKTFQVAIAGPAVSLGLFFLFSAIALVLGEQQDRPLYLITANLAVINLILSLFNLLPGLPLDGGQVLKALLWKLSGSRFKGTRWAAQAGQSLGTTALILGVLDFLSNNRVLQWFPVSGLWLALIGWFIAGNASSYIRYSSLQEAVYQTRAGDAMTREFRVVDAEQTLRQFADLFLMEETHAAMYFAASDGRYRGMVTIKDLHDIERSQWDYRTLREIAHPLTDLVSVMEETPITQVIQSLEEQNLERITVLSPAGSVSGVIDRGDIVRAVARRMGLTLSDLEIKRIKTEGTYPAGLPLAAIAAQMIETED